MHGLKFDKKSNKNPKLPFFTQKRSLKNIEKSLKGPWKVLKFCIWKSVGTMWLTDQHLAIPAVRQRLCSQWTLSSYDWSGKGVW